MPMAAEWSPHSDPFGECGSLAPKGCQWQKLLYREVPGVNKVRKMFFTYILKSLKDGSHYYGHSKDVEVRLKNHNNGKVRSTKGKRPWKIHYVEVFDSKSKAYKRELYFKSIDGYNYLKNKDII